jgi:hypothetical protein
MAERENHIGEVLNSEKFDHIVWNIFGGKKPEGISSPTTKEYESGGNKIIAKMMRQKVKGPIIYSLEIENSEKKKMKISYSNFKIGQRDLASTLSVDEAIKILKQLKLLDKPHAHEELKHFFESLKTIYRAIVNFKFDLKGTSKPDEGNGKKKKSQNR